MTYDADEVLKRVLPRDGFPKRFVPAALRLRILCLCHYFLLAGYVGEPLLFNTKRRESHWAHIANKVYATVRDFWSCALNRQTKKIRQKLRLLSPSRPLEYAAMNILGPLPKTKSENRFIAVINDWYFKLEKQSQLSEQRLGQFQLYLLTNGNQNSGILSKILTDGGPSFTSRFFQANCAKNRVTLLTTTEYHPQINGQVGQYNATIGALSVII